MIIASSRNQKIQNEKRFYLFLGQGALGSHLYAYFSRRIDSAQKTSKTFLNYSLNLISSRRAQDDLGQSVTLFEKLKRQFGNKFYLLFCTRDSDSLIWDQLTTFISPENKIFFSASLADHPVQIWHPLMSFLGEKKYALSVYEKIPFVGFGDEEGFYRLFPFLRNSSFQIKREHMLEYHAQAFLACGLSQFVWSTFTKLLQSHFSKHNKVWNPILSQTFQNLLHSPHLSSGPLARGENDIIEKYRNLFFKKNPKSAQDEILSNLLGAFLVHDDKRLKTSNRTPKRKNQNEFYTEF
jgi:hypothetical protein